MLPLFRLLAVLELQCGLCSGMHMQFFIDMLQVEPNG